jgi:hypothetical protein
LMPPFLRLLFSIVDANGLELFTLKSIHTQM